MNLHGLRLLNVVVILAMVLPGVTPSSARANALLQDDVGTPTPTDTPTPTLTGTPAPGDEPAPTSVATATLTETPPAVTPTATETVVATATASATLTETVAITPTLTPSASATVTATLTQTPSPTETPTDTPTATPVTPTPTPTIAPTITPTSTQPADLPIPTPTILPTATITTSMPISLALEGLDSGFIPGEPFAVAWQIGIAALDLPGLELQVIAHTGFTPAADLVGSFDPISHTLLLPSPQASGLMVWNVPPEAEVSFDLQASLRSAGAEVVTATLVVPEEGLSLVPMEGGVATGLDGRVKVTFPQGAADEALEVRVRYPSQDSLPPSNLSGAPFEITAESQANDQAVHVFDPPLTIEVTFQGKQEASLFYYDPESGKWRALPGYYDREAGVIRAQSEHLSIFDVDVNDWQAAQVPTLESFQVAQQSGAATHSYPIWTPPGPGGLQPSITLSYNSQVIDDSSVKVQSSWVGMGWSLDTGYIVRNTHGTMDGEGDDTYSIVMNGVSNLLLEDENGVYHTADESFWKISYSGDIWTVWDKQGNRYVFGKDNSSRARYPNFHPVSCPTPPVSTNTWKWALAEAYDMYEQKLTYTYYKDWLDKDSPCANDPNNYPTDVAIYPVTIEYPNGHYLVEFEREARLDYDSDWEDEDRRIFFERYRLKKIYIKHDANGGSHTDAVAVRIYTPTYTENVFGGYEWDKGWGAFSLTSLLQSGLSGATLPLTEFSYGDSMHLTQAENGYGGSVVYSYESPPWYEVDNNEDYTYLLDCTPSHWTKIWGDGGLSCYGTKLKIGNWGARHEIGSQNYGFHPGAVYNIHLWINKDSGNPSGRVKFQYGPDSDDAYYLLGNPSGYESVSGLIQRDATVVLPADAQADYFRWVVECSGGYCLLSDLDATLLTTRYRVSGKTLSDEVTGASHTFNYEYDGAATNDTEHSAAVAGSGELYGEEYGEYRGVAMSREIGPIGTDGQQRIITTWYAQDDQQKGQTTSSLVSTRNFWQPFNSTNWGDYSSTWAYSGSAPVFERKNGDVAAKMVDLDGGWNTVFKRAASSLTNSEATLVQFRMSAASGGSREAVLALEYGTWNYDFLRWGVHVHPDGSLRATYCTTSGGTSCHNDTILISAEDFELDTWYVLSLAVDDDQEFQVIVWQRDRAGVNGQYTFDLPSGKSWKFVESLYLGTLYVDEYSEGNLYNLSYHAYDSSSLVDMHPDFDQYADLAITWTRPTSQTSMSFEGDGTWIGTRTTYAYNPSEQNGFQYGNQTGQVEAAWDGANWDDYRAVRTWYYPYTGNGKYLVGLPGASNRYKCNDAPCDYGLDDLLSSQWNLYDGQTVYWSWTGNPIGQLTAQRAFVCFANDSDACYTGYNPSYTRLLFSDVRFGYDTWGNQNSLKTYSGYGYYVTATGQSVLASSGLNETISCYGSGAVPTCNDDGYHTYKTWERNGVGHDTSWSYSGALWQGSSYTGYTVGVPVSETGPNGSSTIVSAEYDAFGRLTKVIRPGHSDSSASPTVLLTYNDSASPFYTTATQKIDASTSLVVRKVYDGLGRLIQTQTGGAVLFDGACSDASHNPDWCDVIVDFEYDGYGQIERQTIPLALSHWGGSENPYRGCNFSDSPRNYTSSSYDLLGRVRIVTATDNTTTETSYPSTPNGYSSYAEMRVENARGNVTRTLSDVWGRARIVIPLNGDNDASPINPTVSYSYNALDQLESASRGGAVVDPSYDYTGRKVKLIDPDMGTWYYSYNGMGLLTSQKDARCSGGSCVTITYQYDTLGRLTQKSYTIPGGLNVATTNTVTYGYDYGTNGKGQRTSMSDGSGSAEWTYDLRGRMLTESKTISGSGTFLTEYTYNTGDLMVTRRYPADNAENAGETVTYTYRPQGLVNSVIGTSVYVKSTTYTAAGQVDLRQLGDSSGVAVLKTDYEYFAWNTLNGQGRLKRILSQVVSPLTTLQDLRYYSGTDTSQYDAVGNLLNIYDHVAGAPQTQTFSYDNLDRLHTAQATNGTGGNGDYGAETYDYSTSTGNLSSKTGVGSYSYGAQSSGCLEGALASRPHAVTTAGTTTYCYDLNGSMTRRDPSGGAVYNFQYDAENRLVAASGSTTAGFAYDGDGARVKETSVYKNLAKGIVVTGSVAVTNPDVVANGDTQADSGSGASREYAYTGTTGLQYVQIDLGAQFPVHKLIVWHYNGDGRTYHNTKTQVSSDGTNWTTVFDSAVSGEYAETLAGKTHTFTQQNVRYVRDYLNGSTANSGNHWVEIEVWGYTTTSYVGDYFEWNGSTQTMTRYYYAGGVRVAVRNSNGSGTNGLVYLLGDHLGSTSLTADPVDGDKLSELRFKAWGETRYALTNAPTDRRYTGQVDESTLGLQFFNARWYDSYLNRWASPDQIIPDLRDPQSWDRYSYVRNNPVNRIDPSGHKDCEEDGYCPDKYYKSQGRSTNYPSNEWGGIDCDSTLSGCFGDTVVLMDFSQNGEENPISIEEFNAFSDEVAEDLSSHDLTWPGIKAGRQAYDTPFYNGGESERRTGDPNAEIGYYPADQQVCIDSLRCSDRSEINYIAQGMWGAAVGEPKIISHLIVIVWKYVEYGEKPSEDTLFWLDYGYDYYQLWQDNQN